MAGNKRNRSGSERNAIRTNIANRTSAGGRRPAWGTSTPSVSDPF